TIARASGDVQQIAKVTIQLGEIALETADLAEAYRQLAERLTVAHQLADDRRSAYALEGLAAVAAAEGSFEHCLVLVGAADALRQRVGIPHQHNERSRWAA